MSIFSSLGMKIAGGIGVVLAILLGIQTVRLDRTKADLREVRSDLAVSRALIAQQNAAVEEMRRESDRRAKAAEAALSEARKAAAGDRELAKRLAEKRPLSGRCATPPEIMGADL